MICHNDAAFSKRKGTETQVNLNILPILLLFYLFINFFENLQFSTSRFFFELRFLDKSKRFYTDITDNQCFFVVGIFLSSLHKIF